MEQKMVGVSGHTYLCLRSGRKNVCLDGLVGNKPLKSFEKMHARDRSAIVVARGYRALHSHVAAELLFPQGPVKSVRLRMPYYGIKRKFEKPQP